MAPSVKLLSLGVACLYIRCIASTSFEALYEDWLEKIKNSNIWEQCTQINCFQNAEKLYNDLCLKTDKFRSPELKHPIMTVSLFTISYPRIHHHVNKWLDLTNGRSDDTWMSAYSVLLQRAMDIFLPIVSKNWKISSPVYRGQHCDHDMNLEVGAISRFPRFLSTSFNPNEILLFGEECPIAIELLNARGLPIETFSECPHEEEVLIKPGAGYIVKQRLTDLEEVKRVWEKIVQTKAEDLPVIFYQIEMIDVKPIEAANSALDDVAEVLLVGPMIATILQRRGLDKNPRRIL